jgi:hypothetical protein
MFSTAEKIETIVDSFRARGTTSGTFGSVVALDDGEMRVEADGFCVIVRGHPVGWSVLFKGFEAINDTLYEAARDVLDAGARRNRSTMAEALR